MNTLRGLAAVAVFPVAVAATFFFLAFGIAVEATSLSKDWGGMFQWELFAYGLALMLVACGLQHFSEGG